MTSCTSVDLPEPETPVTTTMAAQRDLDVDVLQIVHARAEEFAAGWRAAAARRGLGTATRSSPRR